MTSRSEASARILEAFGIVYVDYPTLERVPKASYGWYRDFIATQRNGRYAGRASG